MKKMKYTHFHRNTFLFVNKNADGFQLPDEIYEVDVIMYYNHEGIGLMNEHSSIQEIVRNYECSFFNKEGEEIDLCEKALFAFMGENGSGQYTFYTRVGVFEGANIADDMLLEARDKSLDVSIYNNKFTIKDGFLLYKKN